MDTSELIKIAVVTEAHGIKGEVKLRSFAENPDFFETNQQLSNKTGTKKFTVKITGAVKDILIARIEGVQDRNSAELLKNTELFIPKSVLPENKEGEFYINQLIGLEVRSLSHKKIGKIVAVHNFGAGDIVEFVKNSSASEMLPFSKQWIEKIDLEARYIVFRDVEYL